MAGPRTSRRRDPAITSRIMGAVRAKNSRAELALRRELHRRGIRYRVHVKDLPGRPDIAWRRARLAVFVDGDMWHGRPDFPQRRGRRDWPDLFRTNTTYWLSKIERNVDRDREVDERYAHLGWEVLRLWETDVLANAPAAADRVASALTRRRQGPTFSRLEHSDDLLEGDR